MGRAFDPEPHNVAVPQPVHLHAQLGAKLWAMDITYIPMARSFVYLAVVLDWFSRRVLSWRVSITMEAAFCVETLQDALALCSSAGTIRL